MLTRLNWLSPGSDLLMWKGYINGDIGMELEDNLSLCLNKQLNLP